ncbi:MAG: fibronectin [Candidatus Neomarinimicrobiota bacterium]|nr:MAG: fibronectin [Candidatus Neomarinimicrobiota bacterium]
MGERSIMKTHSYISLIFLMFVFSFSSKPVFGDETKWISIGMLQNWFSDGGCEIEVGRRHEIDDQQDGFQWPALYEYQDMQAAKGLWIGAKNYNDPRAGTLYNYKVVHVGPRILDESSEFMPQEFKLIAKYNHPAVVVDGVLASTTVYQDVVNEVDPNIPSDRILYNVVNTSLGVTVKRKIYAYSNQYHDNYFIYDFTFTNTGIYDKDGDRQSQTLKDVIFFFQYRWAMSKYMGAYGYYYAPQATTWGQNTVNEILHPFYGDQYRATYAWYGLHSKYNCKDCHGAPNVGSPKIKANGFLGGCQFPAVLTLHVDTSPDDMNDDPDQPTTAPYFCSDDPITQPNDQFNANNMTTEYAVMSNNNSFTLPSLTHAERVGYNRDPDWKNADDLSSILNASNADELDIAKAGGISQAVGYGPYYNLEPGDSIHIVMAECVGGLSWEKRIKIGKQWYEEKTPYIKPDGSQTSDRDEFKDAWVFTARDSLIKTFDRIKETYENDYVVDQPPPPPDMFTVTSGGDRITLEWSNSAESYEHFAGYKVYRIIHKPDTTFDLIFECGQGTDNPLVNRYEDREAQRGFDYYYYVTSFDDGTVNTIDNGVPLESSLFWTRTIEPAYLRRPPGDKLSEIRVVPNPYNIKAKELQYGESAPDRIMFYNIPPKCLIKIFTERGDLVETINHTDGSGDESWNSITSSRQVVVSGIYIAYFEVTEDYNDPFSGDLLFRKGDMAVRKIIIIR